MVVYDADVRLNKKRVLCPNPDLEIRWIHLEWDLKEKPWRAEMKYLERLLKKLKNFLPECVDFYFSAGGIHVLGPIKNISWSEYPLIAAHYQKEWDSVIQKTFESTGIEIKPDPSAIQVLRLMRIPGAKGEILPNTGGERWRNGFLPIPRIAYLLPKNQAEACSNPNKLKKLSGKERIEACRFAERWLKDHLKWLRQANPGEGRNTRLWGFVSDIAFFDALGLIDSRFWLMRARDAAINAKGHPIHNWEDVIERAKVSETAVETEAYLLRHLQRYSNSNKNVKKLAALFSR